MKRFEVIIHSGIVGSVLLLPALPTEAALTPPYENWTVNATESGAGQDIDSHTFTPPSDNSFSAVSRDFSAVFGEPAASASLTLTLGSNPNVSASASAFTYPAPPNGVASGYIVSSFEVINLGGGTAASVPIIVSASGGASASATGGAAAVASAHATWGVLGTGGTGLTSVNYNLGQPEVQTGSGPSSASFTTHDNSHAISVGTIYGIDIMASATADVGGVPGNAIASAYVNDLGVIFDPTFAQANDYEIVFSPGVTPVPEPTTMVAGALLLLPVGLSTLRLLRKRQSGSSPSLALPGVLCGVRFSKFSFCRE